MFRPLAISAIVLVFFKSSIQINRDQIFHAPLNGDGSVSLNWILDYSKKTITFEVHIPSLYGWFALGFSERGHYFPADYCLLWKDLKKRTHFDDTWSDTRSIIHVDKKQDCQKFRIKHVKNVTKFTFERQFDTCDFEDYVIKEGTTHVVWSRGADPLYKLSGLNITSPGDDKGMVRVQLLKNTNTILKLPSYVNVLDIVADKVEIPSEETTYWCHVHKLNQEFTNKHHVYRYEAHISDTSEGLVHHMEVFHCEAPPDQEIPLYVGKCFANDRPEETQVCKRVLAAWAMGAPPFTYPEEAGLPLGGADFNPYVMLEVHYNNPELKSGFVDSSGIRFYVSPRLKQMDAGVIELGLEYTDKMAIPPGQESFQLTGYCVSECTAVSLPPEGITIFGSQLHTHLAGIKVHTRHVRDGIEMMELNRDDHYSTHFQEIRKLKKPVKVLPGDALITQCDYNTEERENVTLGGFAITDEMCVNYVHYFPATDLEVCKSAISDQALNSYFNYMKQWENQNTSFRQGISDNYKAIRWNKMRVQLLTDVYKEAPLSMQCNMSSGDRFPGYWENTPVTPVLKPLPPPPRTC
ncbi:tyramine beta-hydroxylase [Tenebrio molitor]|uniref:tyramine beta-hydroxylase n=1 Tax=Tenebrio molitor TaxID=7067 RepID=UPI001C3A6247|nr:unnamed protein product [Tenebrio molitor]